jgi:hypothetical protein
MGDHAKKEEGLFLFAWPLDIFMKDATAPGEKDVIPF